MNIFQRGVGVLGYPCARILLDFRDTLGWEGDLYLDPYSIESKNLPYLRDLTSRGAKLVEAIVMNQELKNSFYTIYKENAIEQCKILLELTPPGIGDIRKDEYSTDQFNHYKAMISQGSEHSWGSQFLFPECVSLGEDKFIHISTCNTQAMVSLLRILSDDPDSFQNLDSDFTIIRRDADIAKNDPHVTGPLFQFPKHPFGTHHSYYLQEFYKKLGMELNVTSSSVTINSPYMHTIRFKITSKDGFDIQKILKKAEEDPFVAVSDSDSTNAIFALGRDIGYNGRIFYHSILLKNTLHYAQNALTGFILVPGDSNTLVSTLAAVLLAEGISPNDVFLRLLALIQKLGKKNL
jgi:hypothetical protein